MKDIKGYEGLYAITEDGQVWSYSRKQFKKPSLTHNGYERVQLHKDGVKRNCRVHRLVAEAYLPNPDNLPEVHHINSIRTDNRVDNLQWVSKEENLKHRDWTKDLLYYATKMQELGFVFTPEQLELINFEVNENA